jgi:hypothetical protein
MRLEMAPDAPGQFWIVWIVIFVSGMHLSIKVPHVPVPTAAPDHP